MKEISAKKKIGLIMGIYYHIGIEKLAKHYHIKYKTAQDTLEKLHLKGRDKVVLDYLKSAEPYYEKLAEALHTGKKVRFKQGIDDVVREFGVKRKDTDI